MKIFTLILDITFIDCASCPQSKEFQARQSPRLSMADSAEDVMVQKKRRSQAVLKVILKKEDDFYRDVLDEPMTDTDYIKRKDIYRRSITVFPGIQKYQKAARATKQFKHSTFLPIVSI